MENVASHFAHLRANSGITTFQWLVKRHLMTSKAQHLYSTMLHLLSSASYREDMTPWTGLPSPMLLNYRDNLILSSLGGLCVGKGAWS